MTNLDERKVKDLLHEIVHDIQNIGWHTFSPTEDDIHRKIEEANLLTDQAPCATVKKQIEDAAKQEPIKVKKQPRLFK